MDYLQKVSSYNGACRAFPYVEITAGESDGLTMNLCGNERRTVSYNSISICEEEYRINEFASSLPYHPPSVILTTVISTSDIH